MVQQARPAAGAGWVQFFWNPFGILILFPILLLVFHRKATRGGKTKIICFALNTTHLCCHYSLDYFIFAHSRFPLPPSGRNWTEIRFSFSPPILSLYWKLYSHTAVKENSSNSYRLRFMLLLKLLRNTAWHKFSTENYHFLKHWKMSRNYPDFFFFSFKEAWEFWKV